MNRGFLKENITSLIAIVWTIGTLALFFTVLTRETKSDDKTTYLILTSASGIITFMFGYYFGASKQRAAGSNVEVGNIENATVQSSEEIKK